MRGIGVKNRRLVKRVFDSKIKRTPWGEVTLPTMEEVIDALPSEMWDTWEGAYSEIRNIINDLMMSGGKVRHRHQVRHIRYSKKGRKFIAGSGKGTLHIGRDSKYGALGTVSHNVIISGTRIRKPDFVGKFNNFWEKLDRLKNIELGLEYSSIFHDPKYLVVITFYGAGIDTLEFEQNLLAFKELLK